MLRKPWMYQNLRNMRVIFLFISLFISSFIYAQRQGNLLLGGAMDIYKTDHRAVGEKVQIGLEMNYFLVNNFTFSAGAELWTYDRNSLALGMRWYPVPQAFMRFRGLIGEDDINIGMGFSKPVGRGVHLEGIGDYYFEGNFALRAGLAFVF
jgi:hypothetical protein